METKGIHWKLKYEGSQLMGWKYLIQDFEILFQEVGIHMPG